jgi:hypothetical protein
LAQIFTERANRVPLLVALGLLAAAVIVPPAVWYWFSPAFTDVGYRPEQPVPFSHALHAGELGMDCRYCHVQVERAAVASVPPTQVCMNCHQLVKRDSPLLAAILDSAASGEPMRWVRVHKVPEYAYFDHSMHLRAGVGCSSCHGDVRSMEVVTQAEPLSMGWCLDCHRDPAPHLRPHDELTDTTWRPSAEQPEFALARIEALHIAPPVDCSGCHR